MAGPFDWLTSGLGQTNPYDEARAWSDATQARNRAAVGLDANGNPLPTDANGNPVTPAAAGDQAVKSAAAGQALASGVMPPQQQPNATKTDPSLGHILMDMTQYQQREQGFNQAMGAGFAAFSQPRDREWVSKIFNVNEPDPTKLMQQTQDLASQQQGQDRMNSLGAMISGPQGAQIADALHMPGSTPAEKIAALQAAFRADPQNVGRMITQTQQPTPQMANLEQINNYVGQVAQQKPGISPSVLQSIKNQMIAGLSGPEAQQMIADQEKYAQTHNGQYPSWKDDATGYKIWASDQAGIKKSQTESGLDLSGNINKTEELRTKLADLRTNSGMQRIMNSASDSPLRLAVRNALRTGEGDDSWKRDVANQALISDPQALEAVSELKEITGQEYGGAIQSLLGHGLRPSQTEVQAVREGFGQTKNIDLFGDMKSFNAQAIDPLLTRLDEAESVAYGNAGQLKNMPERLRPFTDKVFLTGGSLHADDGAAPEDWEKKIHMSMPQSEIDAAKQAIHADPRNAFHVRDFYKRKGYDISPLAYIPGAPD